MEIKKVLKKLLGKNKEKDVVAIDLKIPVLFSIPFDDGIYLVDRIYSNGNIYVFLIGRHVHGEMGSFFWFNNS